MLNANYVNNVKRLTEYGMKIKGQLNAGKMNVKRESNCCNI